MNYFLLILIYDYIFYQEDDDLISDNYAESMVALFQGNPECTTAAGKVVNLDIHGNASETKPANLKNYRPRYMPGHVLAQQILFTPGQIMFSTPGAYFTIKRDIFIQSGGFHRNIDIQFIYGIMPFGITGYDDNAAFEATLINDSIYFLSIVINLFDQLTL